MKKLNLVWVLLIILSSCDNSSKTETNSSTDSSGLTNPTVIDTTKHPSGMDNSSAISTDTAAMNVQNTFKKADSIAKQQKK